MWNLRCLHHANMTKVNCNVHSKGHLYLQQGLNQWFWIKLRFQRQSCYRIYQECLNYYCKILFSPSMRSNQGLVVFMHRCKIGFIYGGIFETTMNTRMTFAFSFIVSNFYPIFIILVAIPTNSAKGISILPSESTFSQDFKNLIFSTQGVVLKTGFLKFSQNWEKIITNGFFQQVALCAHLQKGSDNHGAKITSK